ncbi:MAG TPA: hypothetical protein VE546_00370 [Streptomyces sp.]|uniref:hypothetical protein n=1 Tax=Streptomyces sp. TaxID=1931 RepID=UPI002D691AAC|nr:hypothetical protein [Streptomyces sp.]HZG02022.1 hypothetical protein [Streptomyces sp.]
MTDRRRRAASAPSTGPAPVPLRQRWWPSSGASADAPDGLAERGLRGSRGARDARGPADDNPFAPPPEGRPEQPWRPRLPHGTDPSGSSGGDTGGGRDGGGDRPEDSSPDWGSRWSSRQPRRESGGFGGGDRPEGPGERGGGPGGLRWDPTDPVQRRARYALLAGMWAFFFALFSLPWVATPLGALAVYWGASSLRAKAGTGGARSGATAGDVAGTSRPAGPEAAAAPPPYPAGGHGGRPHLTAAVSGLITGVVALAVIAAQFSVQLAYRDYFVCVEDALTNSSREACERHLPERLRPLFGERE